MQKTWWKSRMILLGVITMATGLLGLWQARLVSEHPTIASGVGVLVGMGIVWLRVLTAGEITWDFKSR